MNRQPHGSNNVQPTAQVTAHHAGTEDGDLKFPHLLNIGGDIQSDWWLVCGRTWVWRTCGVCA